jgi:hypothetical protein
VHAGSVLVLVMSLVGAEDVDEACDIVGCE